MSQILEGLSYTKDHEWAKIEGTQSTIGITDHAQSALGDVVFVDLPKVGRELKKGEVFGAVESIKAVSDLYSPVDGRVVSVNSEVVQNPSSLNKMPYTSGWLIKVELKSAEKPADLLTPAQYKALVESL